MQHLAIIPDGNRRWARQNKLSTLLGHQKGSKSVKHAINVCLENKIRYLSIYTFSLENFNRSEEEKDYLFKMIPKEITDNLQNCIDNKIRVRVVGNRSIFPKNTQESLQFIEEKTQNFDNLNLNFLFCYGGRQEILEAVKTIFKKIISGIINLDKIDEQTIRDHLWSATIPDPDLIIRTSGISRLSNFFTFQSAYSELIFLDCYWPEITKELLQKCIDRYKSVSRNFGK